MSYPDTSGSNGAHTPESSGTVLITGGAGFIGTNLADRLLTQRHRVRVLDNLSRGGVEENLRWLERKHGSRLEAIVGDVRDRETVRRAVDGVSQVFHFAAQVAVTTSLTDPRTDFDINVGGTINLLEELRTSRQPASLIYTSTNKVYGGLDDVELRVAGARYEPDNPARQTGISESRPLDFHTPYGCSKGAAEQYVLDYARCYSLPATVFRMSCIYGPHQFGTEDQGWVAHFLIRALEEKTITIYGDGRQVRDILWVEDLLDAFQLAQEKIQDISGQAFNIGGGPERTISLLELLDTMRSLNGMRAKTRFENSRTGDQRYYVSDTGKFRTATGWTPTVSAAEGIRRLNHWLTETRQPASERAVAG